MQVKYPHCAGIDIAKREHFVAVPADAGGVQEVRSFGGFTGELERMVRWLKKCGVAQGRVDYWRGGIRTMGETVAGSFRKTPVPHSKPSLRFQ